MKKFILFIILLVCAVVWSKNWVSSGRMDNFIEQHYYPKLTPKILFGLAQFYYLIQQHGTASHYYKWIINKFPDHPQILKIRWELGQAYEEIHRKDLALEQYVILKDSFTVTRYGQLAMNRWDNIR